MHGKTRSDIAILVHGKTRGDIVILVHGNIEDDIVGLIKQRIISAEHRQLHARQH
jgi:hypothetical protein